VAPNVPTIASLAGHRRGLPLIAVCHVAPTAAEDRALRPLVAAVIVGTAGAALRERVTALWRDWRAAAVAKPLRLRTAAAVELVACSFPAAVSLAAAAARCNLSVSQFSRRFHREQGQSFKQFVVGYRIERACEQMQRSPTPLKQIGFDAGFRDLAYFSRAFRRRMGVSPSGYRAAFRKS
jgi:AraC-like DNA-binding protein